METNLKKYFVKIFEYVPGFNKINKKLKVPITAIIILICFLILIPKSNKINPLIQEMLNFSPVKTAEEYLKQQGPKAAYDYINFYENLPGVTHNEELNIIKEKAKKERKSIKYIGKELTFGVLGLEHHEAYAKVVNAVSGMIPYSKDAKDLAKNVSALASEWSKYKTGNVDMLHLGLAGLGVAEIIASFLPVDIPGLHKIKMATNTLLDNTRFMNENLKKIITQTFDPVFDSLKKSDVINDPEAKNLITNISGKKEKILSILDATQEGMDQFQSFVNLSGKHKNITPIVAASSSDISQLDQYSDIAIELSKENKDLVLFGGEEVLKAAMYQKTHGGINVNQLLSAIRYGPAGLNALVKLNEKKIQNEFKIAQSKIKYRPLLPIPIIILIWLISSLIIIKTWMFNSIQTKGDNYA